MAMQRKNARLEQEEHVVQDDLYSDLTTIMAGANEDINKLQSDNFKKMFWDKQVCACACMHSMVTGIPYIYI